MLDMFNNLFMDDEMKLTLWADYVSGDMEEDTSEDYSYGKKEEDEDLPFQQNQVRKETQETYSLYTTSGLL